jgi:iron complex transport system ATP-binding protein
MHESSMTLAARDISFSFAPGKPVLSEVSCVLEAGKVTAILGPNGAGKTTLLRVLAGLISPAAGEVRLGDRLLAAVPVRERARLVAYGPQHSSVAFAYTVRAVVHMGRYAVGEDAKEVEEAMRVMEIADRAEEPFEHLSAGQKQRVTLARVLAQLGVKTPAAARAGQVLLADEPCSAMDPRHALHAMGVVRGLAREGLAVGMVLHDLNLISAFADRVIALGSEGKVVAEGLCRDTLSSELLERIFGVEFVRMSAPTSAGRPNGETVVFVPGGPASAGLK